MKTFISYRDIPSVIPERFFLLDLIGIVIQYQLFFFCFLFAFQESKIITAWPVRLCLILEHFGLKFLS